MADTNGSILGQIETQADYYAPNVYAGLLTFFSNLSLERDSLDSEFIPLSAVDKRARNPKLFVVGVLPPSVGVTGILLDRSATSGTTGVVTTTTTTQIPGSGEVPVEESQPDLVPLQTVGGQDLPLIAKTANGKFNAVPPPWMVSASNNFINGLQPEIQPHAKKLIELCAAEGITIAVSSGPRSPAEQDLNYSKGRNFPGPPPLGQPGNQIVTDARGTPPTSLHQAGWAFDVLVVSETTPKKGKPKVAFAQPDPPEDILQKIGALGKSLGLEWGGDWKKKDKPHFQWTGGLRQYQILPPNNQRPQPPPPVGTAIVPDNQPSTTWQTNGAPAAMESRKQLDKIATTQITVTTDLGKRFQDAQRAQIIATQRALENMRNTPPLRMLVNPRSFTVSGEKITSDGNWGRNGPIIEHWGNQQDKISGSGQVAGFYSMISSKVTNAPAGSPGLTRMARNFSKGYQNFLSLYLLYRNNAGLYLADFGVEKRLNLSVVGTVYIYYDNILYLGSFDSFNVTEDDTKPFTLEYSFDFTVRATFLLDNPPEQIRRNQQVQADVLPSGDGDIFGGKTTFSDEVTSNIIDLGDIDDQPTSNIIDLGDIDALVATSPQKPGGEAGAKLAQARIQANINLTTQKYKSGEIDTATYHQELSRLQGELALAL